MPVGDVAALATEVVRRLADPDLARREGERARERSAAFDQHAWGDRIAAVAAAAIEVPR